ncbi:hypothetical protein [Streptomyces sp. S.PB5]|uniref:hypothetical protein n=1 Tax=Streptomyces sp. S.PB5 TaxID=3020844 RepID=UPI0025B25B1E|nr:hypothetical protein [Streptomyces sp. S.PB5]MDN3021341.1 hypothetical protein [Streptomyces sp. S.PB5]
MRERPDVREKRIDLNVPQVAGAALAAVVAAKLASYFGVYGTILGAGLVSVIATCGGSVFQHLFRRTGEQLREATVTSKTPARQPPPAPGEFTEGTVHRAKVRSWKRPVLAAALVFGVTMGGITAYELVSGSSFSGGDGTTVGSAVTGHDSSPPSNSGDDTPTSTSSPIPSTPADGTDGTTPSDSASSDSGTTSSATPTPSASDDSGDSGDSGGTPSATPGESSGATSPTPSASSRSGTDAQDRADPATP